MDNHEYRQMVKVDGVQVPTFDFHMRSSSFASARISAARTMAGIALGLSAVSVILTVTMLVLRVKGLL